MNERISKLEDQCWVKVPCDFDMNAGGSSTIRTVFDRKKFAELIVKECARIIMNGGYWTDILGNRKNASPDEIAQMIKEHFGVEE